MNPSVFSLQGLQIALAAFLDASPTHPSSDSLPRGVDALGATEMPPVHLPTVRSSLKSSWFGQGNKESQDCRIIEL